MIVCGETGSGKSTQLPKLCWALGLEAVGWLVIPSLDASRPVRWPPGWPKRLGLSWDGRLAGRFDLPIARGQTKLRVMTDGILLAEAQRDRHFRVTTPLSWTKPTNVPSDFLLSAPTCSGKTTRLRVIVTRSATIDLQRMAQHFDGAVVNVEGRTYPVEVRWRPRSEQDASLELESSVASAFDENAHEMPAGDVLTFLSGEREIRELTSYMRGHLQRHRWWTVGKFFRCTAGFR